MKKTEKYLNFFGDTQNYKMHNPLPNPYNLRGNPDLNANSADQGDGLNGTPNYSSFNGEVQDNAWSNHPGFIGINWGGKKNDCPSGQEWNEELGACALGEVTVTPGGNSTASVTDATNPKKGGFISAWFDGNKKYYKCENGQTVMKEFPKGQPAIGYETYKYPCLSAQQRQEKKDSFWGGIGDALTGLSTGYNQGLKAYQPGGVPSPQFDPNATNTTTTTSAGVGGNVGKTVGWVVLGLVGVGLLYMVVKAGSSGGGSTDAYISRV